MTQRGENIWYSLTVVVNSVFSVWFSVTERAEFRAHPQRDIGGDFPAIKHKLAVLRQHCEQLERVHESIKYTTLIDYCVIAQTEASVLNKLTSQERDNLEALRQNWLIGTPEQIRERLVEYEEAGIQELIVRSADAAQLEPVRLFVWECLHRR